MPLRSMTGYGRAGFSAGNVEMTLEISSVNRRGLETFVSGPQEWTGLERLVTNWVRERISRGKISLIFQTRTAGESAAFAWDNAALQESLQKLETQATVLGIPFAPDAGALVRLAELHRVRREGLPALDDAQTAGALETAVRAALEQLIAMREREGDFLKKDLSDRLTALENLTEKIGEISAGNVARYREVLFERLRQAGLSLDLSDERVLKEVALFADRCDIAEETTRLKSHFIQFRACFSENRDVGRKLDFICQEMNRELNTVGSKANQIEVTRCVIEAKNELERIREQVQNVE